MRIVTGVIAAAWMLLLAIAAIVVIRSYSDREWRTTKSQVDSLAVCALVSGDLHLKAVKMLKEHDARLSRLESEIAQLRERNPVARIDTTHIQRKPFLIWDIPDTTHNRIYYPGYRIRGDSLIYDTLETYRLIPRGTIIPQTRRSHEEPTHSL